MFTLRFHFYLTLCSGLLKVEDRNYDIQPIEDSSSFQHLIFQVAADEDSPDRCGVTGDFLENQAAEERELPTNESRKVHTISIRVT